jgi:acyl-CoA synthetase (AMP-forming)/AMP-acid ligase II/acyl carrier protein
VQTVNESISALLARSCDGAGQQPALLSLDAEPISYGELVAEVAAFGDRLRQLGIRPHDRVAMALPDGLDAAVAFLGVSSTCAFAPFNPRLTSLELSRYLTDLRPKALILPREAPPGASTAAARLSVPVWTLERLEARRRDRWRLSGPSVDGPSDADTGASGTALLLFTSGTTSRPKLVPLTQAGLCASARNIGRTLQLGPADRCLNVMPLFHIHGLIGGLLSSLAAGGSVVCTPGFSASDFFRWLEDFSPTWYTAVPTMHQAVLARHARLEAQPRFPRLRFIRSSSSALSPQVMAALEAAFDAPAIEAYGMTEAAHQMASNPLPPARRKPGSVGLPAGTEIAILDEDRSEVLPAGQVGEIGIRGPAVTSGYVDNDDATAAAFADGWFRTGDQGYLDRDGYLTITGRLKEIINRAGEKIAPREIDDALMEHPAVAQAVAFAVPEPRLGEEVAAAVVLRPGATASQEDLQRHVANRLVHFKVPRQIVIVAMVPAGPTGKPQRRTLAAQLGLDRATDVTNAPTAPRAPRENVSLERHLAAIWTDVLGCGEVGPEINFLDAGGDSISAARLVNRLQAAFQIHLTLSDLFNTPTVRQQAVMIQRLLAAAGSAVRGPGL